MTKENQDEATHASGKRSAESASSDVHRISHSRDKTVGNAGADPQELDTRGKIAKPDTMKRPPTEK